MKSTFEKLQSGLFDSSRIETEQLRVITGGATNWSEYNSNMEQVGGGTDCIGANYVTTFTTLIGPTNWGDRDDSKIAHPNDPGRC